MLFLAMELLTKLKYLIRTQKNRSFDVNSYIQLPICVQPDVVKA